MLSGLVVVSNQNMLFKAKLIVRWRIPLSGGNARILDYGTMLDLWSYGTLQDALAVAVAPPHPRIRTLAP